MNESFPQTSRGARRPPRLRPYQLEPLRAILNSIRTHAGRTFVVEISRQGGKNELSAQLEALLLERHRNAGGGIVKTAPTLTPQLKTSYTRLIDYLLTDNIPHRTEWPMVHVGRATCDFRSAEPSANVAGATASILLEADEAQDIDPDVFNRRFRPMAATTNATTVLYGTAWDDTDLLQKTIDANTAAEASDGIRRNFIYDHTIVETYNPAYAAYVAAERARLGPDHPVFQTEYMLIPLAGEGRLFTPTQLHQLQGSHARLTAPLLADTYIGGLDLGGQDMGTGRLNDRTVLTIAKLRKRTPVDELIGITPCDVVQHLTWRGAPHAELLPALNAAARDWRLAALVVDATGIGEATASILGTMLPRCQVEPFKFTQISKSELGFSMLSQTNAGALTIYADDGSADWTRCLTELQRARRETRPNRTIDFRVPDRDGNDDYLISLALTARCAQQHPPRIARGR